MDADADKGRPGIERNNGKIDLNNLIESHVISGHLVNFRQLSELLRRRFLGVGTFNIAIEAGRDNFTKNGVANSKRSYLLQQGAFPATLKQRLKDRVDSRETLEKSVEKRADRLELNEPTFVGASTG